MDFLRAGTNNLIKNKCNRQLSLSRRYGNHGVKAIYISANGHLFAVIPCFPGGNHIDPKTGKGDRGLLPTNTPGMFHRTLCGEVDWYLSACL